MSGFSSAFPFLGLSSPSFSPTPVDIDEGFYEVFFLNEAGARQGVLQFNALDVNLVSNNIGACVLTLDGILYDIADFKRNYRLEIERDGVLLGEAPFIIRKKKLRLSNSGEYLITLTGLHISEWLKWRNIAYYSGSTGASSSNEYADDLLKRLARENIGTDAQDAPHVTGVTDEKRDIAAPLISSFFTVEADSSQAVQISPSFARDNLFDTMVKITQESYENGTPLYFGIEKNSSGIMEFRTRIKQWGSDRTNDYIVSPEYLNLSDVEAEWDWTNERTVCLSLGNDEAENRVVVTDFTSDATSLNWSEGTTFVNTTNINPLAAEASAFLRENKYKQRLSGRLQETDSFRFNQEWTWGDKITAEFAGDRYKAWINNVRISVQNYQESITANLEAEL